MPCREGRKPYERPTKEALQKAYGEEKSIARTSVVFGVSGETIRNWLKLYEIPINAPINTAGPSKTPWRTRRRDEQ